MGALHKVFGLLREKLDALHGGPAAAVPSTLVSAPAPPANSAPAVHPAGCRCTAAPSTSLPLPEEASARPLGCAESDS